ncbi:MAG: hypothetical protein KF683_20480, partial [Rubrivivax sp.]|nr:hypothetical protein [Rubrivivax sp.]
MSALLLAACGGGGDGPAADRAAPSGSGSIALAAAPSLPAGDPPQIGAPYRCGNVSLGSARSGEIQVPDGEVCVLVGTTVDGNVKVGRGSVLDAREVTVIGNVQADGAASVVLVDAQVGGSVQLEQGGSGVVADSRVTGDVQFDDLRGPLAAQGNQIGGNLQAMANRGGVTLIANRITGNLQCKDNQPAPRGRDNVAASREDQCAALESPQLPPPDTSDWPPMVPPVSPLPPAEGPTLPIAVWPDGENVTCRGRSLGALSLANVVVPAGARCELLGTRLTGNLLVEAG